MGKRSTSRRLAMQALYQADLANADIDTALKNIFENEKFIDETTGFAERLARNAWENREAVDKIISDLAVDWPLDRIGKVDRAILRLTIQELRDKETPTSVAINESIELAKKYSGQEASKFINGILGGFVRQQKS